MSAIQHIAATLANRGPWSMAQAAPDAPKPTGKTDTMRQYLQQYGSATAVLLAMEADLASTGLVGALLKGDLARGRITYRLGRYWWNPAFDERLQADIDQAVALLKRHGWKVRKP
jgi:membrane protein DedA with SNARE-associated domain